ncbi:MAG TPA: M23 family metallopeptidase [Anaerovoracaceae bacterium]|nr:M23 family metallopeptidase [Anaerovoracaceae bacterium]
MNSPLHGKFRVSQKHKGVSHKGIDLVGVDSKEIHATVDGVVEVAKWDIKSGTTKIDPDYGMGQYVRIKGDDTNYMYYFGHISELLTSAGQRVKKGDVIGIEGSSGNATGSHVHYEIRKTTSNTTFLNVSELSGIPNELGTYVQEESVIDTALEEARRSIQEKAGLDDNTMNYLASYRYGKELLLKLAAAMN